MSYVEKTLQPGETLVFQTALHWIVFVPAALALIAGIAVYIYAGRITNLAEIVSAAGLALVLVGVVTAILVWIKYISTAMAITNRRVIAKVGFIWRRTIEMERQKVESVSVDQSILGRILG